MLGSSCNLKLLNNNEMAKKIYVESVGQRDTNVVGPWAVCSLLIQEDGEQRVKRIKMAMSENEFENFEKVVESTKAGKKVLWGKGEYATIAIPQGYEAYGATQFVMTVLLPEGTTLAAVLKQRGVSMDEPAALPEGATID